jgi:hypothetical protein
MVRGAFVVAVALAGCDGGKGGAARAPVDPSLDLAVVAPGGMKRVEVDFVWIERAERFPDAAAWVKDLRMNDPSFEFSEPVPDGDGWVVAIMSRVEGIPGGRIWHRPLGPGLAITCKANLGLQEPTEEQHEHARKVCFGTQRVGSGVFVPFRLSPSEPSTGVELAMVGEPLNWSVELERVADSPEWRFRHEGRNGRQRLLDEGTVAGGSWFLSGGQTYSVGMHYDAVVRRTIGAHELACSGDNYHGEAYTRRQLALCLSIEKP